MNVLRTISTLKTVNGQSISEVGDSAQP